MISVAKKKRANVKKSGTSIYSMLLIMVLMGGFLWQIDKLQDQVEEAKEQVASLTQSVNQQKQTNEALKDDIETGPTAEQLENIAREELGLALSGEKVFYDVSN